MTADKIISGREACNRYVCHIWRSFKSHNGFLWATSLTYTTLIALVPLMAVALSLFKILGGFEEVQQNVILPAISNFLDPSHKIKVMDYVQGYVNKINAGALGVIGTGFFVVAFVPLFQNMEKSINSVWGRQDDRAVWIKFATYWTITTLGPMALVMLISVFSTFAEIIPGFERLQSLQPMLGFYVIFALFLVYKLIPNTEVKTRPAIYGAIFGGLAWQLANYGYQIYMEYATAKFTIYGSLGAIPVFLLWIWINWIIMLLGAELSKAIQYPELTPLGAKTSPAQYLEAAIKIYRLLFNNLNAGIYLSEPAIRKELNLPPEIVTKAIDTLKAEKLLIIKENIMLPGRAAADISLHTLSRIFIGEFDDETLQGLTIIASDLNQTTMEDI